MRNEELTPEQPDSALSEFTASLKRTTLDARCINRDTMMYRCGEAAAMPNVRATKASRKWLTVKWQALAIAVMAFVAGGLAGRWTSEDTNIISPIANTAPPAMPQQNPTVPANLPSGFEEQRMEAIRSGEHMFAAMDPAQIQSVQAVYESGSTQQRSNVLRAGMLNYWLNQEVVD